ALHEGVDGMPRFRSRWNRGTGQWLIRPLALIFRTLGNPAADRFLLRRGQLLVNGGRRHDAGGVLGEYAGDNQPRLRLPGDDRRPVAAALQRLVADVQAHAGTPGAFIRSVTPEAG